MKLSDIIDIENQFLKEKEMDSNQIRVRDRKIGRELQQLKIKKSRYFSEWLERVRSFSEHSPGSLVETGHQWLGIGLITVGVIVGGLTASSVLDYDGSNPVNIINFLAIIIGFQWITIFFFLLNQLPQRIKHLLPFIGEFYSLIRGLIYHTSKFTGKIFHHLPISKNNQFFQSIVQIRKQNRIYQKIEKWLIVGLTHRYSIAFNIGALLTCLYLITFSDLAFAWNTTLNIESSTFHKLINYLAKPWAILFSESVPSLELVEASRYFRLDSRYAGATASDPGVVGKWWSFLILSLLFYGFLPRFVIFVISKIKIKFYLSRPRLYSAYFEFLYERLTEPIIETRSQSLSEDDKKVSHDGLFDLNFEFNDDECTVIKWGDIRISDKQVTRNIENRFGCEIHKIYSSGTFDYEASNSATLNNIRAENSLFPIIILIEPWETPDASLSHFLTELRKITNIKRRIVILLLNTAHSDDIKPPNNYEWKYWSKFISKISDPYLYMASITEKA